jgi:hypothetical protein
MGLRNGSGIIATMVVHHYPGWATNNLTYRFGPLSQDDVTTEYVKHPDTKFEATVSDSSGATVVMRGPTPAQKSIDVQVKWENGAVTLTIEGIVVDSQVVP